MISTSVLDKIRGNLEEIPSVAASFVSLVGMLKPSLRRVIFLHSTYSYLLLYCYNPRNFNNAILIPIPASTLAYQISVGKMRPPCETLLPPALTRNTLRKSAYLILKLLALFILMLRNKLSPLYVICQTPVLYGEYGIVFPNKGVAIDLLVEEGAGALEPRSHRYVYALWLRDKIRGYLSSNVHQNTWDIPRRKVCLFAEIPRRLESLVEAFPDLKEAIKFIEPYKKLSRLAIVFTQPLYADTYVRPREAQKNVYEDIIAALMRYGYRILLRKHLRDWESYPSIASLHGVEVWQGSYFPGEVVAAILKDSLILSVFSTVTMAMGDRDRKSITLGSEWLYKRHGARKVLPVDIPHRVTGEVERELVAELMEAR